MNHIPCTRERITTALLTAGLSAREAIDCAGWLAGLQSDQLPHLSALTLGECQHVMALIDNAVSVDVLARRYRTARRLEAVVPPPEQEGVAWLR